MRDCITSFVNHSLLISVVVFNSQRIGLIFFVSFTLISLEKANTIVNALIRQGLSHLIGCVVIDEMHVLGDKDRGYHLEILIRYHAVTR